MKTKIESQTSQIGLLLPKHVKPESGVAPLIPESGIIIKQIVEQYSFKGYGGGGVRSRYEFVGCPAEVLRKILEQIDAWFVSMDMRPRSTLHGRDDVDSISYVLLPEFCNGGLFTKE